jgi:hypothetical protein
VKGSVEVTKWECTAMGRFLSIPSDMESARQQQQDGWPNPNVER